MMTIDTTRVRRGATTGDEMSSNPTTTGHSDDDCRRLAEALAAVVDGAVRVEHAEPSSPWRPGEVRLGETTVAGGLVRRAGVERDRPLTAAEAHAVEVVSRLWAAAEIAAREARLVQRSADLVDSLVLSLDQMFGVSVQERLVHVARGAAEVLDAKGWAVRILLDGDWVLVAHEQRRGHLDDPAAAWAPFDARTLDLDEGSLAVRPGEGGPVSAALDHCRLSSLIGASGYDPDAVSWTVCLVGDDVSGDLSVGRTALAALVPAALGFPSSPVQGGLTPAQR